MIQRVREAQVTVERQLVTRIESGLVVLLGVAKHDTPEAADRLADRIATFRVFGDDAGKMNRSIQEIGGQVLVVPQFTLVADVEKGRRPSFDSAAQPQLAEALYQRFVARLVAAGLRVETGQFGARMIVSLQNDGPVTFILES